jgi:ATP-dependent exoDNAse (exonuclease V) beta subunit
MELTAAQRQAVDFGNLGRDVCVVAGPGSGKTRVLVDYFELLVAEGVPPSRILAITFTEKAAANMKARLAASFASRADLRRELERANVSTVHGFCARLLRENAIFAGVDPEFRVLDEQESLTMQRTAVAETLDSRWAADPGALRKLLRSVECLDLGGALLQVYDAVRASGRALSSLRDDTPPAAPGFDSLLDAASQVARLSRPGQNDCTDSVLQWRERFEHLRGAPASLEQFEAVRALSVNLNRVRSHPAREYVRPLSRDGREPVVRRLLTEFYAPERAALLDALEEFERAYRVAKIRAGALDFADLEDAAVRLLEERADVRERIRAQFDQVLMDEYQDTNGLQARLLELVRPRDRFFAVGDINQSIYGFRHAEPDVFRGYRDSVLASGKRLVDLPENFRSRAEILDMVQAMLAGAPGIDRRRLIPAREFPPKNEPSVEAIAAVAATVDDALSIEARWIARRIRDMEGSLLLAKGLATFGDIAILVRNSEVMDVIGSALDGFGVPYLVSRGKGFFETREVKDLTRLLRVLVNPLDEISLAAVLRSPFVEASDDALFALAAGGPPAAALHRLDSLDLEPEDRSKLTRFAAQLDRWRAQTASTPFDLLLLRAMDETGYPFEPGTRAGANIEKFLGIARSASRASSLFEFVQALELLRDSDPREADAPPEDSVNAVRVMTVHAAKGLEFPIVFIAAMHKGVNRNMGALMFSPRIGLGARWHDPTTGDSKGDLFERAIRDEATAREQEEANRLLYVAMTRAEEHLVLSFSAGANRLDNWAAKAVKVLPFDLDAPSNEPVLHDELGSDGGFFPVRTLCVNRAPEAPRAHSAADRHARPAVEQLDRPPRAEQHESNATVTAVNLFANCPRRYYLGRYLGWEGGRARPLGMDVEIEEDPDLPADAFGRQVHALLAGQKVENPHPDAATLSDSFASTDLGRRAARASAIEREFDFIAAIEGVVLRGQIDLWFEENGELIVVDYKTDRLKPSEAEAKAREYELQLRLYALALAQLAGRAPDRAYVHFLRVNRSVPVALSPSLFDDPLQLVREFRQAQESLNFPLRPAGHCRQCPYVSGLCPAPRPI